MASKMSDKMHILANKRVQNILSWVQLPIKFGSTLNKIAAAAAGSVKEGIARKTKEHVKEGVSASVTEENKCT